MDNHPKQFVLYKDAKGEWRWRLRAAGNNKTIADSGEGYTTRDNAIHGARLVMQVAPGSGIWDAEAEEWV